MNLPADSPLWAPIRKALRMTQGDGRIRFILADGRITLRRPKAEDVYCTAGAHTYLWRAGEPRARDVVMPS